LESHLSKRKEKISLKAKVLDAWNSMSEWNNTVTVSYKPGGDRYSANNANQYTNRLNCASSTMNDCRVSSNPMYPMSSHAADRVLWFLRRGIHARVYTCAGYMRRAPGVCMRRGMHAGVCTCAGRRGMRREAMYAPGMHARICMRREYATPGAGVCMRRSMHAPGSMRREYVCAGVRIRRTPKYNECAGVACAGRRECMRREYACARSRRAPGIMPGVCMRRAPGYACAGVCMRGSMHAPGYACAGELAMLLIEWSDESKQEFTMDKPYLQQLRFVNSISKHTVC
jgi:hypothetical protein